MLGGARERGKMWALLRLSRPQFLLPGLLLFLLGFLLAGGYPTGPDAGRFALGYLIFLLAQISLSYSNDYFDQEVDAANTPSVLSGGSGVLNKYPEYARTALYISWSLICLAMVAAFVFQLVFNMPWYFLPFVLFGALLGYFYAAPPLRLSYRGLGEVSTVFAAGLVMPSMGYMVVSGGLDLVFLITCLPLLAFVGFFILSVEMPDLEGDRAGGKVNLMVHLGLRGGAAISFICVSLGTLTWSILTLLGGYWELELSTLMILCAIPIAASFTGLFLDTDDRRKVIRQVKLNVGSLVTLLVLVNLFMFLR
ncbi:MAG: prenyltransferase [Methanomassiliicoccus sp.]|nr:MAG: prenyltransferase [Methanomassiliicoccus sp.]